MSLPSLSDLANAIAQNEGYGVAGAIPTVANNPGNLELGDIGYGTLNAAGGNQITVFPDATSGWQGLLNQLNAAYTGSSSIYNPNQTLAEFGQTYSGGNANYGANLASQLGVPATTQLGALAPASSTPGVGTGILGSIGNFLNPFRGAGSASTYSARLIILILGIIVVGAGLFSFKTTQTIVTNVTKAGKKAAEVASA